jgi:hypothetical protein
MRYIRSSPEDARREEEIAAVLARDFPNGPKDMQDPLFSFVESLSKMPERPRRERRKSAFAFQFCYSYFAPFGDPLIEPDLDPYPEGLLARLADAGVDGVWLPGLLYTLCPFPWQPALSDGYEKRLDSLAALVDRGKRHNVGVYLFLNEPRGMPLSFFAEHPHLLGAQAKGCGALCSGLPEVKEYVTAGVEKVCRAVPDLAGFFTVTAAENLTHCWSWFDASSCPRCCTQAPEAMVAESVSLIADGVARARVSMEVIAWDWEWPEAWTPGIIERLPETASVMSVSELGQTFELDGATPVVNEYSLSHIGPGPTALKHWEYAAARGLKTVAKIQAGNTWELASVPYIPVPERVALHVKNLREAGVHGLMVSWTQGAYPSPNMEVLAEMAAAGNPSVDAAMAYVAAERFGDECASAVVEAWKIFSRSFEAYPFHIDVIYNAPVHIGPANLLWEQRTGHTSTMVCFPYDDIASWCADFPPETVARQFGAMADGFEQGIAILRSAAAAPIAAEAGKAFDQEIRIADVCAILFRSVANQVEFVIERDSLAAAGPRECQKLCGRIEEIVRAERDLALRLHAHQVVDSRIGFEAGNQYFFIPIDLAEKVLNCDYLLEHWLPQRRGIHDSPD